MGAATNACTVRAAACGLTGARKSYNRSRSAKQWRVHGSSIGFAYLERDDFVAPGAGANLDALRLCAQSWTA